MEVEEPPPGANVFITSDTSKFYKSKLGGKKILLSPETDEFTPPPGLKTDKGFKRLGVLNPALIQHNDDPSRITLFPRLIYTDDASKRLANITDKKPQNSCILKLEARLNEGEVDVFEGEEVAFQAQPLHGVKGLEDLRIARVEGEEVIHGLVVFYNGFDARTGYLRTPCNDPINFSKWEDFGIFFPNISAKKAIELTTDKDYKLSWVKNFGSLAKERLLSEGKFFPKEPFLSVKDCAPYPKRIINPLNPCSDWLHYGLITRFFPDIQMIPIKSWEDLARKEFWEETIPVLQSFDLIKKVYSWEQSHIGLAGPPQETSSGVLMRYHGANMDPIRDYKAGAVLLDLNNPYNILARTKKPYLEATEPWERDGVESGNIVFPTGAVTHQGVVHEFYGAGDKFVGHTTFLQDSFLKTLFD